MRTLAATLGICVFGFLQVDLASAQQLSQPLSVRQAAYDYYDYFEYAEKPAPTPGENTDPAIKSDASQASIGCDLTTGCDPAACSPALACRQCSRCRGGCGFGEWLSGITHGGWIQVGGTANGSHPTDNYNGPIMTNDRADTAQMNHLWYYFERKIDTSRGFDIGGRFDIIYGTDWRIVDCYGNGLENRMNGADSLYGIALPLMYVEAGYGDLSVKIGRMPGILGYEQVPPMANFFYSHSYSICYGEPVLITGMMGTYALSDQVSVLAGFHQGVHQFENINGEINFQGGVKWTSRDGRTSLAYCLDAGRNDLDGLRDEYIHSIVFQRQINRRLKYVFQSDYGFRDMLAGEQDTDYYSFINYLFYELNQKWSVGMRAELFRDEDGTRIVGAGNLPNARGWMGAPGYAGSFTELTFGLNYKPRANMLVRPELRWDWYAGDANPNGPYPYPFDDGTKKSQFTAACDFIWMF